MSEEKPRNQSKLGKQGDVDNNLEIKHEQEVEFWLNRIIPFH